MRNQVDYFVSHTGYKHGFIHDLSAVMLGFMVGVAGVILLSLMRLICAGCYP